MGGVRRVPNPDAAKGLKELIALGNRKGKIGWFETAKYPDGTPVAYVAMIQEMGSPKNSIPPRPFFRPTIEAQSGVWKSQFRSGAKAILAGNETAASVMEKVTSKAAGDVRRTITKITQPDLSPVTLLLRKWKQGDRGVKKITGRMVGWAAAELNNGPVDLSGVSTKPLVDTGYMLETLTHKVEDSH